MPTATTERSSTLATARQIVDRAKNADRELTPTEQAEVEQAVARIKQLDAAPGTGLASAALIKQVMGLASADYDPDADTGLFNEHAKAGFLEAIRTKTAYRTSVPRTRMKAGPILEGNLLPASGQGISPALYPNGVTAVADLMNTVQVDGPTVRYYRVGAGVAAVVAEGAPKPDAGIGAEPVDVTLQKIAALLKVSDELSEDAPWLLSAMSASLVAAVVSKENEEVVATLNATSGILTKNGAAAEVVDLVAQAIASMQSVGTNPNAVLVTPDTLAAIRQAKAQTSGVYITDPLAGGPTTLHGLPLYAVNVAGANTAWVIDGSGLAFFRRSAVTFEVGYDADDWSRNLRTGRAETRGKAGVMQPLAVCKITLT